MIYCTASYGKAALEGFLQQLTEEQRASIRHITADGARWIAETVKEWCPNAERSIDPFHVVGWVNDALDEVRKRLQREATERVKEAKSAKSGVTKEEIKALNKETNELKDAKYATLKNPENLTAGQAAKVDLLAKSNPALYRAYLLKEKLRLLFKQTLEDASIELKGWLSWAQRCRIPEFQKLREKIKRHYDAILSTIKYGLSNSIVEALNNKIKLCIRMAYGFRNTNNMLGLVMLRCSDLDISLPGRSKMTHYY
jgi:transposase